MWHYMEIGSYCIMCVCLVTCLCLTLWLHRLYPTRLPYPRDSPGKNTAVGCHFLFQDILPTWDRTHVPCLAGRFFPIWATRETPSIALWWALSPVTDVGIRTPCEDTERRKPCGHRDRLEWCFLKPGSAEACQHPPGGRRGMWKRFFFRVPKRKTLTSSLKSCEGLNF